MDEVTTGTIDAPDNTGVQDVGSAADETTAPANWMDSVPDDIKTNPEFEAILKDAEAYKGLERPPENPEDYKIEGLKDDALKEFGEVAKSLELTQKQAESFYKWAVDFSKKSSEAQKANMAKARESLKTDSKKQLEAAYGKDAPNVEKVSREAIKKWGDVTLIDTLEKTGLIYEPSILSAFYRIGSMVQPDVLVPSGTKQPAPKEPDNSGKIPDSVYKKT
jgi:hypothetical protein